MRDYEDTKDSQNVKEIFTMKLGLTEEQGLRQYNSVADTKKREGIYGSEMSKLESYG